MIPDGGNQFSDRSFSLNKLERNDDSRKVILLWSAF
jgi:hypothetical protein